jgi:hypothetical protein
MNRRLLALALACALPLAAAPASAQAPKPGKYYEDSANLGFKVKVPDGYSFIPPEPDDPNLIGKYSAGHQKGVLIPPNKYWEYTAWLVAFDRRPVDPKAAAARTGPKFMASKAKDVADWVEKRTGAPGWKLESEKPTTISKVEAVEYQFTNQLDGVDVALYAMLYKLQPDLDLAIVFNGPGEKKWSKFENVYRQMARSFQPIAVERPAVAETGGPASLRDRKRAALQRELAGQPGWNLYETPNYFLVSNNTDKQFLEELMERLDAIRLVYEETYPASKAQELRQLAKEAAAAKASQDPEPVPADGEPRTVAEAADPMERSRCSVVRVCASAQQYHSYGGPEGSAGFFNSNTEELVIFDDKAVGGRAQTWKTMNHEAFHQYIFNFFGNLAPHSWYNEGTGDFYSGYEYKNKRFTLKPFDWRERLIQGNIRQDKPDDPTKKRTIVPLQKLVRMTKQQYYEQKTIGDNYAQGWSLIWFLRTGSKNARCWNPAWDSILDTYLRALVQTGDLDKAVDEAFAGVDWDQMESCWKSYILQG